MKARKQAPLQALLSDVMGDLGRQFAVTVREVKEHLEALMEREFIARSAEDSEMFVYLP